ncbi:MAG: SPASM domain-containing protein, partial [Gemmatimonadales bacterium]
TLSAVQRLATHKMDFVIQTTITKGNRRELSSIVEWASDSGAVSFNAYFVVSTGRAERMRGLDPEEQEEVLESLVDLHFEHLGKMMVRAKCAPQFMRLVHQRGENTPLMNYGTRCPCGVQYCRITPEGKVTPCPYLPVSGGDLRRDLFATVWQDSELFRQLRVGNLGGRCGVCEYRAVCGGCRARAHAVEGDFLAADPSCAYEPTGDRELILPPVSVTYGSELSADSALHWTPEAEERLRRVPSFVRGVVINRIESYARERGLTEITAELMRDIRSAMPVDFAKRKPFFMNDD